MLWQLATAQGRDGRGDSDPVGNRCASRSTPAQRWPSWSSGAFALLTGDNRYLSPLNLRIVLPDGHRRAGAIRTMIIERRHRPVRRIGDRAGVIAALGVAAGWPPTTGDRRRTGGIVGLTMVRSPPGFASCRSCHSACSGSRAWRSGSRTSRRSAAARRGSTTCSSFLGEVAARSRACGSRSCSPRRGGRAPADRVRATGVRVRVEQAAARACGTAESAARHVQIPVFLDRRRHAALACARDPTVAIGTELDSPPW